MTTVPTQVDPALDPALDPGHGDYFANRQNARRLPWSLYHQPLERDLVRFLTTRPPRARVLVVGCGLMQELDRAPRDLRFVVADVDARAVAAVMARGDARIERGVVVAPDRPLSDYEGGLDGIYAKEVIEHIITWPAWLLGAYQALAPGGALWLSTPNYGEPWLPAIEYTALELVARRGGFTRFGLHPAKFSRRRLADGLTRAGFERVRVRPTLHRLALTAWAVRPARAA